MTTLSTQTISITEFRRRTAGNSSVLLLDVRTPAEFAKVHAIGAQLMPLDQLDPAAVSSLRSNPDDPIYIICQSGGRSSKACAQLANSGLENLYSVDGGTAAWEKSGLPVERGSAKTISLERQVRIAAGSLVLIGLILARAIHPAFVALSAFIAAGLVFAGITDTCGMGMLLSKMPWNRRG
jgi:rhodanese-related sulfurtransferase